MVGQVCVDREYRGKGILDNCYKTYRHAFNAVYDFAITEIATKNSRSIQAHKRIGFSQVCIYMAPDNEEWSVVLWQWNGEL